MSRLLENTKKYRETRKGVLTNIFHHMKARRTVNFSLSDFHERFLNDKKYVRIHAEWLKSGKNKMNKPSIDRISRKLDYTMENIHLVTWAENRYKQTMERRSRKGPVIQVSNGEVVAKYTSQRDAVKKTGFAQGNMSSVLNGKRSHCGGFQFLYESNIHQNPELLK